MLNFIFCGIEVFSMLLFHMIDSGTANCWLHCLSSIAGYPSGPEADVGFNSLMASIISPGVTMMFDIVDVVSVRLEIVGGDVDGMLNTELYWSARISAIRCGSVVMEFVALSRRGPTVVFILRFFLA